MYETCTNHTQSHLFFVLFFAIYIYFFNKLAQSLVQITFLLDSCDYIEIIEVQ